MSKVRRTIAGPLIETDSMNDLSANEVPASVSSSEHVSGH